jgi:hypothetical protein
MGRDKCRVESAVIRSHEDLIPVVNRLNREGIAVYRRLSPSVLTQLMELACAQTATFYESLDLFTPTSHFWEVCRGADVRSPL